MVYTPEGPTKTNPMDVGIPGTLNNPSTRKSLIHFSSNIECQKMNFCLNNWI